MDRQWDYKRDEKHLYMPGESPQVIDVPPLSFVMMDGEGDPNGEQFALAVEALYVFSYAVRMSNRSASPPVGYTPYTVYPLEGVWDLVDYDKPATDKHNLKYMLMIRQPAFLTPALFAKFLSRVVKKKPNPLLPQLRLEESMDGLSCQALHRGPFDQEEVTFSRMEQHCADAGLRRTSKLHREIYLSDPRRTEAARLRTVLRFAVAVT